MSEKVKGTAIGIDLGTTYTCAAVWFHKKNRVEIIPNEQGNKTTPSFVAVNGMEFAVGEGGKRLIIKDPINANDFLDTKSMRLTVLRTSVDSSVHQGVGITIISRLFNFKFQPLKTSIFLIPREDNVWVEVDPWIASTQSLSVWQGGGCQKLGCSNDRSTVLPSFVGKSKTRFTIGIIKVSISTRPLPDLTHSNSKKVSWLYQVIYEVPISPKKHSAKKIKLFKTSSTRSPSY
ncbi:heat shock protein 70 family [Artemisia annua]|uniref:Heat shock protein 70 family n=1 Tax=Artemisia annua TaxID=35608 RepID=A0A2U1PDL8_ARTAN|nr:heat shock protein 70 family [Artemisia annua]